MFDTKAYAKDNPVDYYEDVLEDIAEYDELNSIADEIEAAGIIVNPKSKNPVAQDFGNDTLLQIYFTEVGKIYKANDNNFEIEYSLENRDKIIQMNLKTVISIAKRFIGCGISYEDLIGVGNIGLCVAFDHYNPNKRNTRSKFIDDINAVKGDTIRLSELRTIFSQYYTYGPILEKFNKRFTDSKEEYTKDDIMTFVNKYIKIAKFNSVASMWILAFITNALNTQSRFIRRPVSMIKAEKEGKIKPDKIVNIDTKIGDGNKSTLQEVIPDSINDPLNTKEQQQLVNSTIQLLMDGLESRDKRLICYRYGIGLPRSMSPKEIAERENLSVARVQQLIQNAINYMKERYQQNADKINVEDVMMCFGGTEEE